MDTIETSIERFARQPEVRFFQGNDVRVAVVWFCWRGKYHVDEGGPCQDWAEVYFHEGELSHTALAAVVADGVSTQPLSRDGAEFACKGIGHSLSAVPCSTRTPKEMFSDGQVRFIEMCRNHHRDSRELGTVPEQTNETPLKLSEYATTALCLWTDGMSFWAACVGDGAIYAIKDGGRSATQLAAVLKDGFSNEVRPLSSSQWEEAFSQSGEGLTKMDGIEGFCLLTDGLSESIGSSAAYFETIWPELKSRLGNQGDLNEYAAAFCQFWEDRNFSDDDKTLLAVFVNP